MLSIAATAAAARVATARARGATGDFGAMLAPREAGPSTHATGTGAASAALLMVQAGTDGDAPPRRRRPPQEAARQATALLGLLQRQLLGGRALPAGALEDAAAEAETLAEEAAEPEARRLCAAIALRLRVELAKLHGPCPAA
jgi:hypothetical protein